MDARETADKYIARGGGAPTMTLKEFSQDLLTLSSFVLYHDKGDMHGGVRAGDAFAAMCRLLNVEQHRVRGIVRPESE